MVVFVAVVAVLVHVLATVGERIGRGGRRAGGAVYLAKDDGRDRTVIS